MQRPIICLITLGALAVPAAAAPTIDSLQNNYSYLLSASPNYGLAQGSIIVIYGKNMAPAGLLSGDFGTGEALKPLNKNLGGVSIKITVNGVTTEAIPYYVSPGQIGAILPSATPVGNGTITVTYNGTSAPFPIRVVQSAFGFLTMSGNGLGQAVVQDSDFGYRTPAHATVEDQFVVFWGTGLGPDLNDETQLIASPQSLDGLPFELYIGHQRADVTYHGRSQFPGLDQIVAKIPRGVTGCYVSAYVKTGNYISNFTTIPVAPSGTACGEFFATPDEVVTYSSRENVTAGWLYLGKFRSYTPALGGGTNVVISDNATAQFLRYSPFDYLNYGGGSQPSFGNCVLNVYDLTNPFSAPIQQFLDPGQVTLTLPNGTVRNLVRSQNGSGYTLNSTNPPDALFLTGAGERFIFTGPGSASVGAFITFLTTPPDFNSNIKGAVNISRAQPFEVTWTSGEPDSYVVITGSSSDLTTAFTMFSCTARASAGRLTIPRDILASMVPSVVIPGPVSISTGQLSVYNYTLPTKFTVPGIDNSNFAQYTSDVAAVVYQ